MVQKFPVINFRKIRYIPENSGCENSSAKWNIWHWKQPKIQNETGQLKSAPCLLHTRYLGHLATIPYCVTTIQIRTDLRWNHRSLYPGTPVTVTDWRTETQTPFSLQKADNKSLVRNTQFFFRLSLGNNNNWDSHLLHPKSFSRVIEPL